MSGSGRCARRKERALGLGEVERDGRLGPQAAEDSRQRRGRRLGKYERAGEMDQGTDRAAVVRAIVSACRIGGRVTCVARRICAGDREFICGGQGKAIEMHMPERERELERERKQRQVRTPFRP